MRVAERAAWPFAVAALLILVAACARTPNEQDEIIVAAQTATAPSAPLTFAPQTTKAPFPSVGPQVKRSTPGVALTPAWLLSATPASRASQVGLASPEGARPPVTLTATPGNAGRVEQPAVIGRTAQGLPIEAYWFGEGDAWVAVVGAIHGGYEWNTALLAYEMIDALQAHADAIPHGVRVAIIPAANPDGLAQAVGHAGRFEAGEVRRAGLSARLNASGVDLNRNWGCGWRSQAQWRQAAVNPGKTAFSEPETQALRDFFEPPGEAPPPAAVIFWHSAAGMTLAGGCEKRLPAGDTLAQTYAEAAGYAFEQTFSAYPVSGTAVDWLAGRGIPAIEVELTNHRDTEFDRNLKGLLAVLLLLK